MAAHKTIDPKEFYSGTLDEYVNRLKQTGTDAERVIAIRPTITAEQAIAAAEKIVHDKNADGTKYNKTLMNLIAKKGVRPTAKKVYQSVLVTYFKTCKTEYDYTYTLNGNEINMSPKTININEGYAEFTTATQLYVGDKSSYTPFSYPWNQVTEDMVSDKPESDYVFANINSLDCRKDSEESMKQYNAQLRQWLMELHQEELGKARRVTNARIYDKVYDYNQDVFLAPYILVSYDLGNMIITLPVCAFTESVETPLINNPTARWDYDPSVPPSFSIGILILGGVIYSLWHLYNKSQFYSKALHGYTMPELRKLL